MEGTNYENGLEEEENYFQDDGNDELYFEGN